jgi:YHS domain-containing protein
MKRFDRSVMMLLRLGAICLALNMVSVFAREDHPAKGDKASTYTLTTCPVSGKKLGEMGPPIIKHYKGREVRFCCAECPAKFEKDLDGNLKKLDAEMIKAQLPNYPLDTCVVSGDKLGGEMGKPVNYIYKGQLVRFCCKGCIKDFEKEPGKYLKKIEDARKTKPASPKSANAGK